MKKLLDGGTNSYGTTPIGGIARYESPSLGIRTVFRDIQEGGVKLRERTMLKSAASSAYGIFLTDMTMMP